MFHFNREHKRSKIIQLNLSCRPQPSNCLPRSATRCLASLSLHSERDHRKGITKHPKITAWRWDTIMLFSGPRVVVVIFAGTYWQCCQTIESHRAKEWHIILLGSSLIVRHVGVTRGRLPCLPVDGTHSGVTSSFRIVSQTSVGQVEVMWRGVRCRVISRLGPSRRLGDERERPGG